MRNLVFGKNVINTLLSEHAHIIKCLYFSEKQFEFFRHRISHLPVKIWTESQFERFFPKEKHQKMAAELKDIPTHSFNDFLKNLQINSKQELVLILDRIQDPQNFGAIVRTAVSCGVKTIIFSKTKHAPVNATLVKVSSGMVFNVQLIPVVNLHNALIRLKKAHFWIIATEMKGEVAYNQMNIGTENIALILGNEADGIAPLLQKTADFVTYIPMKNAESLNVNAAAAILLYEIRRRQNFWNQT